MALKNFRVSPLPLPPQGYDPQFFRQFIRTLEVYFSQLDSQAPVQASEFFLTDGTSIVEYNERYALLVG